MEQQATSIHATADSEITPEASGLLAPFVQHIDNGFRLELHVEGVRCAKCIQAIETRIHQEPSVISARVNMSTARLTIVWKDDITRADSMAAAVDALGYRTATMKDTVSAQADDAARLLRYMAIAGFATGNIMLISVAIWSSDVQIMGAATRELLHRLTALIAIPTVAYAGIPFFTSAFSALKAGRTNMDVPISLAVILATGMSIFETVTGGEYAYFDSAVMLLFFLLIGRWLDAKARGKARRHAADLLALLQGTATVKDGKKVKKVAITDLVAGDIILIAAGENVPADATIIEGTSDIDTAILTGESAPRTMTVSDTLYSGALNLSAPLTCRVMQAGDNSLLADIIRLMEQAEQGRARYTRLADKAARLYTPVVHIVAIGAFIGWFGFGGIPWQDALLIAVTTLIITCPCALGLAVPAVQVLAVEWLMKRGILVKSGDALEKLTFIDTVVFDKTGTLTQGRPALRHHTATEEQAIVASSLAAYSKHPLSAALSAAFPGERLAVQCLEEIPGQGISGTINETRYMLGKSLGSADGTHPTVSLYKHDQEITTFTFDDPLRDDAAATVAALKQAGLHIKMLSGDRASAALPLAKTLGIDDMHADVLPDEKLRLIRDAQAGGSRCFMIGDGLNDAPALAQAYVSMSPATGMDITQNTADMVFRGTSLKAVSLVRRMALLSTRLIKQNFMLAVIYNCIAIPLAVSGYVTPLVAAVAMSSSSLIVVGNSFRIRFMEER